MSPSFLLSLRLETLEKRGYIHLNGIAFDQIRRGVVLQYEEVSFAVEFFVLLDHTRRDDGPILPNWLADGRPERGTHEIAVRSGKPLGDGTESRRTLGIFNEQG